MVKPRLIPINSLQADIFNENDGLPHQQVYKEDTGMKTTDDDLGVLDNRSIEINRQFNEIYLLNKTYTKVPLTSGPMSTDQNTRYLLKALW